jgi:hypothetical protein
VKTVKETEESVADACTWATVEEAKKQMQRIRDTKISTRENYV